MEINFDQSQERNMGQFIEFLRGQVKESSVLVIADTEETPGEEQMIAVVVRGMGNAKILMPWLGTYLGAKEASEGKAE